MHVAKSPIYLKSPPLKKGVLESDTISKLSLKKNIIKNVFLFFTFFGYLFSFQKRMYKVLHDIESLS